MQEIVKDYLWISKISEIDNNILYNTCVDIEKDLSQKYKNENVKDNNYNKFGNFTSNIHSKYNAFSYPCPELHKLYCAIGREVKQVVEPGKYYLQCWVNLFRENCAIDWHTHFIPEVKGYHGFYCVNTENVPSCTTYKIPHILSKDVGIKVDSIDGLLVFGKSENDEHKTSEWNYKDKPRVTIAFDVIPVMPVNFSDYINPNKNSPFTQLRSPTNFIPLYI